MGFHSILLPGHLFLGDGVLGVCSGPHLAIWTVLCASMGAL